MSEDIKVQRAYVSATRDKAKSVLEEAHHDAIVKDVIKDLLQLVVSFEAVIQNANGQSADVRVLRKKLDQAQAAVRTAEAGMEKAKKIVMSIVEEIKVISSESGQILRRHEADPADVDTVSATKIRAAAQKIVELIVEAR